MERRRRKKLIELDCSYYLCLGWPSRGSRCYWDDLEKRFHKYFFRDPWDAPCRSNYDPTKEWSVSSRVHPEIPWHHEDPMLQSQLDDGQLAELAFQGILPLLKKKIFCPRVWMSWADNLEDIGSCKPLIESSRGKISEASLHVDA